MKKYIFLIVLAILTAGCIPKYVNVPSNKSTIKAPEKVSDVIQQTSREITLPSTKPTEVITSVPATTKTLTTQESISPQETIVEEAEEVIEEQKKSTSYKVTMKTKKFAFSDTGFLVNYDNSLHLNVLAMGKSVLDLKVKKNEDDVCVGSLCNTKHGFNQSFLDGRYPDEFIENILLKKPIFNGKHLTKTKTGFIQKIVCERFGIKYQVTNKGTYFKDKKNNILIKLREIH